MKKIINWIKVLFEISCEAILKFADFIQSKLNEILIIIYFIFSLIAIIYFENSTKKNWIIFLVLLFITFVLVSFFHNKFIEKKKEKFKPKERFTKKHNNGDITIEESKLNQAIIYLSILEDEIW